MRKVTLIIIGVALIALLFAPVYAQVGQACNIFFHKYGIRNGGVEWGIPFIQYALFKGRIVRKGLTTFYAPSCEGDGPGGGYETRWGIDVRNKYFKHHIVAADPDYWGPGSLVYIKAFSDSAGNIVWPQDGSPGRLMVVCDTGSAIKGQYRFDISVVGQWQRYKKYNSHWNIEVISIYNTKGAKWGQGYPEAHIKKLTEKILKEMEE